MWLFNHERYSQYECEGGGGATTLCTTPLIITIKKHDTQHKGTELWVSFYRMSWCHKKAYKGRIWTKITVLSDFQVVSSRCPGSKWSLEAVSRSSLGWPDWPSTGRRWTRPWHSRFERCPPADPVTPAGNDRSKIMPCLALAKFTHRHLKKIDWTMARNACPGCWNSCDSVPMYSWQVGWCNNEG
jgi:hypothetical protein